MAIAEAAQNIVKHAYKDFPDTDDRMVVQISCKDNKLEIAFFDNGKPVEKEKIIAEKLNGRLAMLGIIAGIGAYLTTGQLIPGYV